MGNCNFKTEKMENKDNSLTAMNKNMFILHYIVGKGGFSRVWRVEFKRTKEIYAMKIMSKFKIYQKKSITSVMNEKKLLENLRHPFIVNMHHAFQDKEHLYLIMDYLGGGDLRNHIIKNTRFSEEKLKFIVACILVALEYIHFQNIIHRDIKPENLVFDENGYLKLTDFGISRIWCPKNENDTSGTPGYMAPEVMMKTGHGMACDLFAIGVIGYECMLGRRPYVGSTRKEIRDHILSKQAKIHDHERRSDWSEEAVDFINELLVRKQNYRLGYDKPGAAKKHPWFNGFDWQALENGTMMSPFFGIKISECENSDKTPTKEEVVEDKLLFLRNQQVQKLYSEYNFDRELIKKQDDENEKNDDKVAAHLAISDKSTKFTTSN